jgi:hypothetical protein
VTGPHRTFDPRLIGALETTAWVSYYRHDWLRFLRAAVGLTRHAFGLPWPHTVYGAWLVLRANQQWAPPVDNDPAGARATMRRFYALIARRYGEGYDPVRAAELEVEWWRIHREHQRHGSELDEARLIDALTELYAYVYGAAEAEVRQAAEQRALAMRHSDRWVAEGRVDDSPLIALVRAALVRSYAALLAAVDPA